jgi:RNA polymerase sigma-70 factor (ECF subfamily)
MTSGEVQWAEEQLLARARAGDREAFGDLVRRYQDTVYTLALRLVGPDLAADVAQEALLRAWRALPRFRGEAAFATWLHRITVNTAWTMRRRARRQAADPLEADIEDRAQPPEQAGEMVEVRAGLRRALAALTPGQRSVVVLRDVYGWSNAEAARELGITEITAKVRLHRARLRLRVLLEESR